MDALRRSDRFKKLIKKLRDRHANESNSRKSRRIEPPSRKSRGLRVVSPNAPKQPDSPAKSSKSVRPFKAKERLKNKNAVLPCSVTPLVNRNVFVPINPAPGTPSLNSYNHRSNSNSALTLFRPKACRPTAPNSHNMASMRTVGQQHSFSDMSSSYRQADLPFGCNLRVSPRNWIMYPDVKWRKALENWNGSQMMVHSYYRLIAGSNSSYRGNV